MIKVVAACGNGMGCSQIIKMKIAKVFKKLKIEATIDHMSVGEARSVVLDYDVVFCGASLVDNFKVKDSKTKVVGLVNLLSEAEIEAKIIENNIR